MRKLKITKTQIEDILFAATEELLKQDNNSGYVGVMLALFAKILFDLFEQHH